MVEEMRCPKCQSTMTQKNETGDWWLCLCCGGEFLIESREITPKMILEVWKDEQEYKRQISKPGSHSQSSRRRKKKRQYFRVGGRPE